jgi:hypothetical protein
MGVASVYDNEFWVALWLVLGALTAAVLWLAIRFRKVTKEMEILRVLARAHRGPRSHESLVRAGMKGFELAFAQDQADIELRKAGKTGALGFSDYERAHGDLLEHLFLSHVTESVHQAYVNADQVQRTKMIDKLREKYSKTE